MAPVIDTDIKPSKRLRSRQIPPCYASRDEHLANLLPTSSPISSAPLMNFSVGKRCECRAGWFHHRDPSWSPRTSNPTTPYSSWRTLLGNRRLSDAVPLTLPILLLRTRKAGMRGFSRMCATGRPTLPNLCFVPAEVVGVYATSFSSSACVA